MKFSTLFLSIFILATATLTFSSCSKDDDTPKPVPRTEKYKISEYGASTMSGNALFTEVLNTDSVIVNISLEGSHINTAVNLYAVIKGNTALENGNVLYYLGKLNNNDDHTGKLESKIKLSFDNLLKMNGSLVIYNTSNGNNSFEGLQAEAEIGENENFEKIILNNPNTEEENGQMRMYQRDKGSYVVIKLDTDKINTDCRGNNHPITVFGADNLADTEFILDSVAHANGISATNLSNISFKNIKSYQGSVKIYCSKTQNQAVISEGEFK